MKSARSHTSLLLLLLPAYAVCLCSCQSFKTYVPNDSGDMPEESEDKQGLYYSLPRGRLQITGKYTNIKGDDGKTNVRRDYNVVIKKYHVADPDPKARAFTEITENIMYDEDSTLVVKDGLLQSANAKPEDKTGEIIVTLVGTAIDAARAGFGGGFGPLNKSIRTTEKTELKPVTEFAMDFDPLDEDELAEAKKRAASAGFSLDLPGINPKYDSNDDPAKAPLTGEGIASDPPSRKAATKAYKSGLAYRRPKTLVIKLQLDETRYAYTNGINADKTPFPSSGADIYQGKATIPDAHARHALLPIKRGFMTKRQTDVVFEDGQPTKIDLKAPSPVLGFVKLPAAVAKMAADAVPTLIKVNHDASKGQLTRETELLKAQSDLIKAQNELNNLRTTPAN